MIQTPRGEYVVLIPHTPVLFKLTQFGTMTNTPRQKVWNWLKANVGLRAQGFDDCSEERPWRARVWKLNSTHAFFFHNKSHALLFKLTFGGKV